MQLRFILHSLQDFIVVKNNYGHKVKPNFNFSYISLPNIFFISSCFISLKILGQREYQNIFFFLIPGTPPRQKLSDSSLETPNRGRPWLNPTTKSPLFYSRLALLKKKYQNIESLFCFFWLLFSFLFEKKKRGYFQYFVVATKLNTSQI